MFNSLNALAYWLFLRTGAAEQLRALQDRHTRLNWRCDYLHRQNDLLRQQLASHRCSACGARLPEAAPAPHERATETDRLTILALVEHDCAAEDLAHQPVGEIQELRAV